ncbi:MAG: flagellar biosynthesis repressor FlbT [Hyphomicrobium sp.]|uniref:flagellar biosynthesis repressor FlbT n=1 Tax=Hyphomicrobium sp. TaxID=82 RepID=UPI003D0E916F
MSTTTRVSLRAGERIFINGAVLKADRRISFEILNDVPYLVEHEIMQAQQTVTPLRQLYYILQTMVMERDGLERARPVFDDTMYLLSQAFENNAVLAGLEMIRGQVAAAKPFEALKTVRTLIPIEDSIFGGARTSELKVVGAGS